MTHVASLPVRPQPRVTFSALIDVLSQPSHRVPVILRSQKFPKPGPVFGYKNATRQLVEWFVHGTALNRNDPILRDHEVAALDDAIQNGPQSALWPAGASAASYPPTQSTWSVNGVEISFRPDVLLEGQGRKEGRKAAATGALKLYLRRDPTTVGPMMAALLYYHRSKVALDPDVDPALCAVTDVQTGVVHAATGSYQRLWNQVNHACQVIASVWPTL